MKKPFIVAIVVILGIIATNLLIPRTDLNKNANQVVEDKIETSQAADIPL